MKHLFITGTDTGVGKTTLTAALLLALRAEGVDAVPFKPVQTGCEPDADGFLRAPDIDLCLRLSGMAVNDAEAYSRLVPYRYAPACSPHLAAEQACAEIDLPALLASAQRLAARHDVILAEGAGGVYVPVNRKETMLDLMAGLGWPVLVAARPRLGTLNHTTLTAHALRDRAIPVLGIVLVHTDAQPAGFIEEDNARTLPWLCGLPLLGEIPYLGQGLEAGAAEAEALCAAGNHILQALRKVLR